MDDRPTYQDLERLLNTSSDALRRAEEHAIAGRLALEVKHEVKNPLETLGNLVYLTRHTANDPKKVEQYMILAEEQMRTLTDIASQTLGFARESESPQLFDLVVIAEAALRIHQRTIDAKQVGVVKTFRRECLSQYIK